MYRARDHADQAVFLRGCEQLAHSVWQELSALCAMDERGRLSPENAAQLAVLGLSVPEDMAGRPIRRPTSSATTIWTTCCRPTGI